MRKPPRLRGLFYWPRPRCVIACRHEMPNSRGVTRGSPKRSRRFTGCDMSSERPFQTKYVKDLEALFKEYHFNKKVLKQLEAELKLRETKAAKGLLKKVRTQLSTINRLDRGETIQSTQPATTSRTKASSSQKKVHKVFVNLFVPSYRKGAILRGISTHTFSCTTVNIRPCILWKVLVAKSSIRRM